MYFSLSLVIFFNLFRSINNNKIFKNNKKFLIFIIRKSNSFPDYLFKYYLFELYIFLLGH